MNYGATPAMIIWMAGTEMTPFTAALAAPPWVFQVLAQFITTPGSRPGM